MTSIDGSSVKKLREKTGAGIMDCKKALVECNGDAEAAVDWLRKKGLSTARKKSDRVTAEGLIALTVNDNHSKGVMLEVNSETDFVARNEKFQALVKDLAKQALEFEGSFESFKSHQLPNGKSVNDEIAEHIAVIGENINLRRLEKLSVNKGAVMSYVHNAVAEGLGTIGVLVSLESDADYEKLLPIGKQVAMHIAASQPEALSIDQLDPKSIEKEKGIIKEQAISSGKPEKVIEGMIEGRIRKYYEEVVLLEQPFLMDQKVKVSQAIEDASRQIATPIKVTGFARYILGEGIEK